MSKRRSRARSNITHDNGALQTTFRLDGHEPESTKNKGKKGKGKSAEKEHSNTSVTGNEVTETITPRPQRQRTPSRRLMDPTNAAVNILFRSGVTPRTSPAKRNTPGWQPTPGLNNRQVVIDSPLGNSWHELSPYSSHTESSHEEIDLPSTGPPSSRSSSPETAPPDSPTPAASARPAGNKNRFAATDVWRFFEREGASHACKFCKAISENDPDHDIARFSDGTSTTTYRRHLINHHIRDWVLECQRLKIKIKAPAAVDAIAKAAGRVGRSAQPRIPYSNEALVDTLAELIIANDLSLNIVSSPQLRKLCLMLREELNESDIPGRTTIRTRIDKLFQGQLSQLRSDMKESQGRISFTTDMWTDPNLASYMAVTANWIQKAALVTPNGLQHTLKLRADLIAFIRVPGRHKGENLATAFLHVLDRLNITKKIGWITCDNATNNDRMVEFISLEMKRRGIPFDYVKKRVRCFPHIVNLACKAVLSKMTDVQYATEGAEDFENIGHDPIATLRSLIRAIRASSLRRQHFSAVQKTLKMDELQLLRDVDVRWSSTLLMIERAIDLRPAIEKFLENRDFTDLQKYALDDYDWDKLTVFKKILQVPHSFQHILSQEKTPTLGSTLPAFEAMCNVWKQCKVEYPEMSTAIDEGIEKLELYISRTDLVPAHVLSMIVEPSIKLDWFKESKPEDVAHAKELFIQALRGYQINTTTQPPTSGVPTKSARNRANAILGLNSTRHAIEGSADAEGNRFLNDGLRDFGSLQYWQDNPDLYPRVYLLALDVLPIQASAVPCERVFSSAKLTVTPHRSRISGELMEALQVLKFSIRYGNCLDFTEGLGSEAELSNLEHYNAEQRYLVEDPYSFVEFLKSGNVVV